MTDDVPATRPGSAEDIPTGDLGQRIGDYVVLDVLGRGATGCVYRALHPQLDREVALKVIALPASSDARDAAGLRVLREGRALARLRHRNVVTVHDVGEVAGQAYLAMELVDGATLRAWAERTPARARRLAAVLDAGRGLCAVHGAGLVHRDVKPDNILVASDGHVELGDFGLARLSDDGEPEAARPVRRASDGTLTGAGAAVGTLPYMAPEVLAGERATFASDQFSFCVTAFECIYGRRPFDGITLEALHDQITQQQIWAVPVAARLPARAHAALVRGLRAAPAERHPSVEALLDAMAPHRGRIRWIVAAALIAAAAGTIAFARARAAPDADTCTIAGWSGVWDPARRLAIEHAFLATEVPYAEQAFRQVAAVLDRYTGAWSDRAHQVCKVDAPEARDELACLRRRRDDVVLLADAYADVGRSLLPVASRLAVALRPWRQCQIDPDPAARPRTADESAALAQLQMELAGAAISHQSGDLTAAETLARHVIAHSGALDVALRTEARLVLGRVLRDREREDVDETELFGAATDAETAGLYALAAEAWIALAAVTRDRPHGDPHRWLALAEIALKRAGDQPELVASFTSQRALQALSDGNIEVALELQRQAAALLAAQLGADDLSVVTSNFRLALSLGVVERCAEAEPLLRAVIAARSRALTPTHPETLEAIETLGICLHRMERAAEAVPLLAEVLRAKEADLGASAPALARPLDNLAGALHMLHRDAEAVALLRRSIALRETTGNDVRLGRPLVNLGTVLLAIDRASEALPVLRRARDLFETGRGTDPYSRLWIAGALSQLHRDRDALAELAPIDQLPAERRAPFAGLVLVMRGHALLGLHDRAAPGVLREAAQHPQRGQWPPEFEAVLAADLARLGP